MPGSKDLNNLNVLIVRLSALGDVLRTLPTVTALMARFPEARFTWLVEDNSAGLLGAVPGLELIKIDRAASRSGSWFSRLAYFRQVIKQINAARFDISIDFHGVLKSGVYTALAGIPRRVGFEKGGSKEGHRWWINERFELPHSRISRYKRNLALGRYFAPDLEPVIPQFKISAEDQQKAEQATAERPILLFPGTSAAGRNKRWPAAYWAWLFQALSDEGHAVRFVFGPADQDYAAALEELMGGAPPRLPGMSLAALSHAMRNSRLLVSCDTGPMHLASILKVPLVALMGPSDPVLNQPDAGLNRMVLPLMPCSPCRNRGCKVLICQDATTPKRVLNATQSLIAQLEDA